MTSAHCVPESSHAGNRVVIGVHNAKNYWTNQALEVEKYILHEGYHKGISYNDIAIIKLKKPVKFENGLNPICLPDFDETDNMFAYGLGAQNQNGEQVSAKVIHEAELDRISQEECGKYWGSDRNKNLNYTICSLNNKKNTAICFGDSGSPVSSRKDGQVYQVGMGASIIPLHCNIGNQIYPNGHEKIFMHLDWIRKHTQDGQFCEGRHHPFAKPGQLASNSDETILDCKCRKLKGQSL